MKKNVNPKNTTKKKQINRIIDMRCSYSCFLTLEGSPVVEPATFTTSEQKDFLGIFSAQTLETVFRIALLYIRCSIRPQNSFYMANTIEK